MIATMATASTMFRIFIIRVSPVVYFLVAFRFFGRNVRKQVRRIPELKNYISSGQILFRNGMFRNVCSNTRNHHKYFSFFRLAFMWFPFWFSFMVRTERTGVFYIVECCVACIGVFIRIANTPIINAADSTFSTLKDESHSFTSSFFLNERHPVASVKSRYSPNL